MRRWAIALSSLFAILLCLAFVDPVHAQASRTWVSGVGDDVNPCSRTAPCKTFAGAISKTAALGEINCLDPAGYGAVTIVKSITIDCRHTLGSILNAGTNGVIINFDSFTDTRHTVRLRGIAFNGVNTGLNGVRILGAAGAAGSEVFIDECVMDGNFGGTARGVSDERTGGGELSISDTTVRNMGGNAISVIGGAGSARIDATLHNVRVQNANFGVAAGANVRMMISRSVFSGHTQAGISADAGAEINIDSSTTSNNGFGIIAGGTVRISNNNIAFNATAINGATISFGNNRIAGNTAAGSAPVAAGAVSNALGQQ